jgi:hypothetical protein
MYTAPAQLSARARVGEFVMRTLLATLVAFALIAPAAHAATAVTGTALPGTNTATLNGTVNPEGEATQWFFEYGTTTSYGLTTAPQSAGSGIVDVPVQAIVSGLTGSTTYHYRLVATSGEERVEGADRTFTTAAAPRNPAAPAISRLSAVDKTATSARLTARIDANRAATTWHVEWGTSPGLGRNTAEQTIATRDGGIPVSVTLDDLPVHRRIYWRVVASNSAGLRRTGTASFTTLRALTGVTVSVFPQIVRWSDSAQVSGRVQGSGVSGLTVALEQSEFPYTAPFQQVATARTAGRGTFRFPSRTLLIGTRYRVVTRTNTPVTSDVVGAGVRARVGIRRTRKTRRKLTLKGVVLPGLPNGRATLQRRTRRGGWVFVRRKAVRTVSDSESRYRFTVWRKRRATVYRVKVSTNDGGAHLNSRSRALLVGKKRKRR